MLLPPAIASNESLVAPSAEGGRPSPRSARSQAVKIRGRYLRPTAVFDTYWRFAAARQRLYFDRLRGVAKDQTDQILSQHRFTNCYRASDRVSQFAISPVAYPGAGVGELDERDIIFRVLLFKVFNRIDTWQSLEHELGTISWRDWNPQRARAALDSIWRRGGRVYSAAYVILDALDEISSGTAAAEFHLQAARIYEEINHLVAAASSRQRAQELIG